MLHAKDNLPAPGLFIAGYILVAGLLGLVLVMLHLPDQIVIVMVAPILFAAVRYVQRVYLWALLVLIILALGVTWQISLRFASSLATIAVGSLTLLIIGELVYRLVAERTRVEQELRVRVRHLELLNEITKAAIAIPDLKQTLQGLADRLGELLDADGCYITLWDEARQIPVHAAAYGPLREGYLQQLAEPGVSMTESILCAGHALVAEDVFNSPYVNPRAASKYPAKSLLGLPLIVGEQKLGAALIAFNQPHHFTASEIERGEQAARQIALAVAKATALEAAQQRAADLEAIRQVGLTLTSSLDPPTVLDAILETTFRLRPGAQDAHIYFYQNERLVFVASLWADGRKNQQFAAPRPDGLTHTVARGGETIAIADIRAHPLFADTTSASGGAIVGIPLKTGQRVVGVMNIAYTKPRAFAATELRVLELLGSHAAIAIENARLFDETRHRVERMAVLNEIGQALTATLKLDELYRVIYQQASRVLTVDAFFIAIYDEPQGVIHFPFICDGGRELPSVTRPLDQGPTSQVIRTREAYTLNRASDLERMGGSHFGNANQPSAAALYVPMLAGTRVVGVISAQSYREDAYQPDDTQVLETIGAQAAIALENARLYDEVQQLAVTDELTGLFNRRGLFQLGQREVERALRFRWPLTAVMLDIDHFKKVNDTHGHPAGDRVLCALAECCRENIRTIDITGRYGGEEFFLLLPETDLTDAIQVAERLRISVENCSVSFGRERLRFTISLGIAELTADIPNLATLIAHADQAQYLAKQSGRNRVSVFQ